MRPLRLHTGRLARGRAVRNTSGESSYVTGTLGLGVRWHFLGPLGLALRLGIVDLLVESPTIAWASDPLGTNEILGFRIGIEP